MERFLNMLRWDVTLQARNYIYVANIVSTAAIILLLEVLPLDPFPVPLATFFIFADPALIGTAFVGAIVMMEKGSRVLSALGVTPSPAWVYITSKTLTMTLNGTLCGLAVAWFAYNGDLNWLLMIAALILSNAVAVLIGFSAVARAPSMNGLMIRLLLITSVLFLPLLLHFGAIPEESAWIMGIIPSYAMLLMINGAADPSLLSQAEWGFAVGYQVLWIYIGWTWTMREFASSIISEGR